VFRGHSEGDEKTGNSFYIKKEFPFLLRGIKHDMNLDVAKLLPEYKIIYYLRRHSNR
jgi:hypothetical protein